MNQITDTIDELELPSLTALDRCDSCGAQAYVRVTLASGDLLFGAHHGRGSVDPTQYKSIVNLITVVLAIGLSHEASTLG